MNSKNKDLVKNVLLVAGSLLVMLLLMEWVLRAFLPPVVEWTYPQESYQFDQQIGHWLKPNQQSFTQSKEVITNSEGLRDHEYSSYSQDGTIRILALGDSQTFGNGISIEDTWPKQLEATLNSSVDDKMYEVINAGLASSDTWQHEIILDRLLSKYNSDVVVLAFYVNDAVKKFTPSQEMKKKQEAGQTRLVYALKKSALLMSLRTAIGGIKNMVNPSDGFIAQQALLKGEDNSVLDARWKQVSDSIASMKRMSDAYKAKFMIFSIPRRDQIYGVMPWDAYYEKLTTIAELNQVSVFSMLEPLQAAYKEHGKELFIPWDGHNTGIANQIIAETLSKQF